MGTTLRVYPRVYGESRAHDAAPYNRPGLSPRVRGIPPPRPVPPLTSGSIPACTGNPPARNRPGSRRGVYPRVYGESPLQAGAPKPSEGLSPRVRGIRSLLLPVAPVRRSIPACTGNPAQSDIRAFMSPVYPRVYGESTPSPARTSRRGGLSPRVRGIRLANRRRSDRFGSIPACTGNP